MTHLLWYPGHELLLRDVARAEGSSLFDFQGKRYVDLESGVWCTSIGHAHPRIRQVLADQAAQIAHTGFNYTSRVVEEAACEILDLLGFGEGRCVFLCSGSEAVEYGVRVTQSLLERPKLMTMSDSYFGAYGSASQKEKEQWFCFDWWPCADCPRSGHGRYGGDDGDVGDDGDDGGGADGSEGCEGCVHWATIPFDEIGGFLLEPGSSSGHVRFPPKQLIRNIVKSVTEQGGYVLVNEVTTGIGQTGAWFGYQHYDIFPDVVAMGKGVGNGYPVSVTAFGERMVERMAGRPVLYAQSHQNDPLGAAVAREVIRTIRDEGLIERCNEIGNHLIAGLKEIQTRTGRIKEVRGRGLMIALEIDERVSTKTDASGRSVVDADPSFTRRVHEALLHEGFIVGRRPGVNVLRLDPSLTIDRVDIDRFLQALAAILTDCP